MSTPSEWIESIDPISLLASRVFGQVDDAGQPLIRNVNSVRELEIVLLGPLGPHRFHDDTVVINENGWYRLITPSSSWVGSNEILFSNLPTETADEEIDELIAGYHRQGLPLSWSVYPWTQPADLGQRLLARGAIATPILAFTGSTAIPLGPFPGVEVELISSSASESYELFHRLSSAGFGLPPQEETFRRQRYAQLMVEPNPSLQLLLARFHGEPVGVLSIILKEESAHLSGAYISPAFQARGIFPSLQGTARSFLRDRGIKLMTGHSNAQSAFWVERFGARPVFTYAFYQLDPPE